MHPTLSHDRRELPRGYVAAIATLSVGNTRIGDYSVRDLSAGGAALVDGPPVAVGTECDLLLRMPGLGSLRLSAVVAYANPVRGQGMGVRFAHLEPEVEDGLLQLVRQELERAEVPSVLVADSNLERLAATAESLAALGERPVLALSALEVVSWLIDPETTITVALLAGGLCTSSGYDLLQFLHAEFPSVRCFVQDEALDEAELEQLLQESVSSARSSKLPHGANRSSHTTN